jgi:hypothetical protein
MTTMAQPIDPIHPNREAGGEASPRRSTLNIVLWVVQVLLALEKLAGPVALPGLFVRFIGVAELLGGLGLILPGLLRIRPGLTPLAAAGLVIIMIGAVGITFAGGVNVGMALIPAVTGLLAAFVAYGRWRLAPIRPKN